MAVIDKRIEQLEQRQYRLARKRFDDPLANVIADKFAKSVLGRAPKDALEDEIVMAQLADQLNQIHSMGGKHGDD